MASLPMSIQLPRVFLYYKMRANNTVELSKLTLPSHVKNLPLSRAVVVAITFSIDDTEYSALMVPSTSQLTEASAAISLRMTYELQPIK